MHACVCVCVCVHTCVCVHKPVTVELGCHATALILFLSADEKITKIWHFIGQSADGRPTVGGVYIIAVIGPSNID